MLPSPRTNTRGQYDNSVVKEPAAFAALLSVCVLLILAVTAFAGDLAPYHVSHTGILQQGGYQTDASASSPSGEYYCSWRAGRVDHDRRELPGFRRWGNGSVLCRLDEGAESGL